ncbi:hypothetical protein WJX72_004105 [[Myrmecia] bisecta]|uniref:Protein kinase domain-containing protein n=1 Tax=[Myrmecia] bisecta TaxID=41462 RepID=A0AAW1PU25_9CHLO
MRRDYPPTVSVASHLVSSPPAAPAPDNQQAGTIIAPYVTPGDFAGYPDGLMPLTVAKYRVFGSNVLPVTKNLTDSIGGTFAALYGVPNLVINVTELVPSPSAPVHSASSSSPAAAAPAPLRRRLLQSALAPSNPANQTIFAADATPAGAFPAFDDYTSVDVSVAAQIQANSSWPKIGSIEGTYHQFLEQAMQQQGYTVKVISWELNVTREASQILARLPISEVASYLVTLRLDGPQVLPFNVRKQTLTAAVLTGLLLNTAGAAFMRVQDVVEDYRPAAPARPEVVAANVTFVVSNKDVTGSATSIQTALQFAFTNFLFGSAMVTAGLPVTGRVLSITPFPGESVTDQIKAYTGITAFGPQSPPPQPPSSPAGPGSGSGSGVSAAAVAGIVVAVVVALVALLGLFVARRRRSRRRQTLGQKRGEEAYRAAPGEEARPAKVRLALAPGQGLTEFQAAAILQGVMDLSGKLDGDSDKALMLKPAGSGLARLLSADTPLTGHHAADYVHGWDIDSSDIQICKRPDGSDWVLGKGSFGMVFRGLRGGVQDVAVKMLTRVDDEQLAQFRKEISILKSLSFDRNIVQFYGACLQEGRPMLVLEYMEGGDVRQAISADKRGKLRWNNKGQLIALDVARGLHFLHSNKVMHSDLKTKNILLTRDLTCAKIGDVGLARILSSAYFTNACLGGTFAYAAPELLLNHKCSEKVDIYSLGVIIWELVTDEVPQRGQLRRVRVPEECPASIAKLIDDCLEIDPEMRPSAKELFYRIRDAYKESGACSSPRSVGSLASNLSRELRSDDFGGEEGSSATIGSSGKLSSSQRLRQQLSRQASDRSTPAGSSEAFSLMQHGTSGTRSVESAGSFSPHASAHASLRDLDLVAKPPWSSLDLPTAAGTGAANHGETASKVQVSDQSTAARPLTHNPQPSDAADPVDRSQHRQPDKRCLGPLPSLPSVTEPLSEKDIAGPPPLPFGQFRGTLLDSSPSASTASDEPPGDSVEAGHAVPHTTAHHIAQRLRLAPSKSK